MIIEWGKIKIDVENGDFAKNHIVYVDNDEMLTFVNKENYSVLRVGKNNEGYALYGNDFRVISRFDDINNFINQLVR